jgi:hypothetical protein
VNKALLQSYMNEVFVQRRKEKFPAYFDGNNSIRYNPLIVEDGLTGVVAGTRVLETASAGLT